MNLKLVINFILIWFLSVISCEIISDDVSKQNSQISTGSSTNTVNNNNLLPKTSYKIDRSKENDEWKIENLPITSSIDGEEAEDVDHPQLFAAYHESYITKEAAKKLKERRKSQKKPFTEKDYDDLLQDIVLKPKNDIYDKKYFDYLPAEEAEESRSSSIDTLSGDETNIEFKEFDDFYNDDVDNFDKSVKKHKKRMNGKRSKRDVEHGVPADESLQHVVKKRNTRPDFFITGRFPYVQPVEKYQIHYNPYIDNLYQTANPWNNRFIGSPTYLNNYYLPAQNYPRPSIPFIINNGGGTGGINQPSPPQNPTTQTGQVSVANRFDPDEDKQLIWDIVDNKDTSPARPSTKFPVPPLIHDSDGDLQNIQRPSSNNNGRPIIKPPTPPLIHDADKETDDPVLDRSFAPATPILNNELGPGTFNDNAIVGGSNQWNGQTINNPQLTNQIFRRPTTTTTTPPPPPAQQLDNSISSCINSIVNCCQRDNAAVRYACFERFGCQGVFWDLQPCQQDVLDAAIAQVNQFYE